METSESILFATVAAMMLVLMCCITSVSNGVEYYSGRDEHDDLREDPDNLLREDVLWGASDNKYDPYNIDGSLLQEESSLLDQEIPKTNLLDPVGYRDSKKLTIDRSEKPWLDYMGNYEYNNRGNPYAGRVFTYPTYKVGGAYLSPEYKLSEEDAGYASARPMNYWNSEFVYPLREAENRPPPGGTELFTPTNYGLAFSKGHMGLTTGDRNKDYMSIQLQDEGIDITGYHDSDGYYDEVDYEAGVPDETSSLTPRMNLTKFDKNRPVNVSAPASFYREKLDYLPGNDGSRYTPTKLTALQRLSIAPELSYDTDKNFYNVTNAGYLMDMSGQGAFETPLGPEINNMDMEQWQFKQTGPMDVTRPTLNWDAWYNGSENFMSSDSYVAEERASSHGRTKWGDLVHPSVDDKIKLEQFLPGRSNVRSDVDVQVVPVDIEYPDDLAFHHEIWSDPKQMEFPTGERSMIRGSVGKIMDY